MSEAAPTDPATLTFEQAADELDSIVGRIDGGELELEALMATHARGQALVQRCRALLAAAEQQLADMEVEDVEASGGGDDA